MHTLDLTGLVCPQVVLRLAGFLREQPVGTQVTVISTDPLSAIDVPFFLDKVGHRLMSREKSGRQLLFVVERGARIDETRDTAPD